MIRAIGTVSIVIGLIANLIPLYGGLYWQWDTFQLLMLYWMETVIIAFWTIRLDRAAAGRHRPQDARRHDRVDPRFIVQRYDAVFRQNVDHALTE